MHPRLHPPETNQAQRSSSLKEGWLLRQAGLPCIVSRNFKRPTAADTRHDRSRRHTLAVRLGCGELRRSMHTTIDDNTLSNYNDTTTPPPRPRLAPRILESTATPTTRSVRVSGLTAE